ncbi:MAG: prepilin peptidase, partial [Chloroflexi bacterium]|nr:prepilin peptidase [Chloroflexota bacterium]
PYMLVFFWLLVGVSIGSFINVMADRLPEGRSITTPPSQCGACGRRLDALDLIPVISYLLLRGRCRTCGAAIGSRVFWVEVLTGAIFALVAARLAPTTAQDWLRLILISLYVTVLITVTVTDLEHQLILDVVIWPAIVIAVIDLLITDVAALPSHLLGGAIGAGLIALIIWLVPGGMGWGDAKLAGFIGLIVGLSGMPFALFVAFVSGGIVGGLLLASGRKQRGQTIALGPFLAIGGAFILLIGSDTAVNVFNSLSQLLHG